MPCNYLQKVAYFCVQRNFEIYSEKSRNKESDLDADHAKAIDRKDQMDIENDLSALRKDFYETQSACAEMTSSVQLYCHNHNEKYETNDYGRWPVSKREILICLVFNIIIRHLM